MKKRYFICSIACMLLFTLSGCSSKGHIAVKEASNIVTRLTPKVIEVKEAPEVDEQDVAEESDIQENEMVDAPAQAPVVEQAPAPTNTQPQSYEIPISNRNSAEFNAAYGETVATICIPSVGMYAPVTFGDSQDNINTYDVTIRPGARFDSSSAVILGGHNYKSFARLFNVQIGDLIYVHSYYGDFTFQVDSIVHGNTDADGSNIYDSNGNEVIDRYSYTNRLYMYTCDYTGSQSRFVVSAVMK